MEANYFTILWWFLAYIDMIKPWEYICPSHPEHPSQLHLYTILLGCSRAPALSALLHASNLHWSSILHMVIYKFQCCSLKSSHPHLLPQSSKVYYLHLCLLLFCIYTHLYHLSKFHIYVLIYCTGVSLSDLLHCIK